MFKFWKRTRVENVTEDHEVSEDNARSEMLHQFKACFEQALEHCDIQEAITEWTRAHDFFGQLRANGFDGLGWSDAEIPYNCRKLALELHRLKKHFEEQNTNSDGILEKVEEIRHYFTGVRSVNAASTQSVMGTPLIHVPGYDGPFALCSDDNCPCGDPGTTIQRDDGYMYVSAELVDFRKDCLTEEQVINKAASSPAFMFAPHLLNPILMCRRGAKRRKLNLEVASEDAQTWWRTGKVPLRPTPLRGKGRGLR